MDQNPEKVEIKLSEVIMLLEEGNNREQIGEHFGLNKAEVTLLFKHEKLKNKRPKKVPSFTITDDLPTGDAPAPQPEASHQSLDENPDAPAESEEVVVDEQSADNIVEQETY